MQLKIRAVMFDLGYTLWNVSYSGEPLAYREVRRQLVAELGEPVPDPQALRNAVAAVLVRETNAWLEHGKLEQMATEDIFREGFESLGLDVSAALLGRMQDIALAPSIIYTVEPDTRDALRALKERGLKLAAVSNTYQSSASLKRSLEAHGLLPYLDALIVSSEVGLAKPHPAIFQEALRRLDVRPEETVFVGDIVWADVLGPQSLGMKAVLTRQYRREEPNEHKPDLIIERLPEIVDYVDRLNGDGS